MALYACKFRASILHFWFIHGTVSVLSFGAVIEHGATSDLTDGMFELLNPVLAS